jgi:hypothetical protein
MLLKKRHPTISVEKRDENASKFDDYFEFNSSGNTKHPSKSSPKEAISFDYFKQYNAMVLNKENDLNEDPLIENNEKVNLSVSDEKYKLNFSFKKILTEIPKRSESEEGIVSDYEYPNDNIGINELISSGEEDVLDLDYQQKIIDNKEFFDKIFEQNNEAKRTQPLPKIDELKKMIADAKIDALVFEPAAMMTNYNLEHICKNIITFLSRNAKTDNFICLLPNNYNGLPTGHFICILREGENFVIYDPLTENNSKQYMYCLILEVKARLNFACLYGEQDTTDADQCGENCIAYLKKSTKIKQHSIPQCKS